MEVRVWTNKKKDLKVGWLKTQSIKVTIIFNMSEGAIHEGWEKYYVHRVHSIITLDCDNRRNESSTYRWEREIFWRS